MFTLLVSWLLVACVPGLLILATLWLGRLERELAHDSVTASDVAEFLEHAQAVDVHTLARKGMPEALESLHRRQARRLNESPRLAALPGPRHNVPFFAIDAGDRGEHTLPLALPRARPAPLLRHSPVNPQVTGTRHVNPV
jgi:hypothetical protein